MWTKTFWIQTVERSIKTAAQTFVGMCAADGLGLAEVDWLGTFSVVGISIERVLAEDSSALVALSADFAALSCLPTSATSPLL